MEYFSRWIRGVCEHWAWTVHILPRTSKLCDKQSSKSIPKKSPSTLRRDKQRWENYILNWNNQRSGPHGHKTKQQVSDCALNFNVNTTEFKPTSSHVKFPKSEGNVDYEFPYSTCDNLEFLELTDNTNVLKHEFKPTKFHLDCVFKDLKSLQESNATWNRCNVELLLMLLNTGTQGMSD